MTDFQGLELHPKVGASWEGSPSVATAARCAAKRYDAPFTDDDPVIFGAPPMTRITVTEVALVWGNALDPANITRFPLAVPRA